MAIQPWLPGFVHVDLDLTGVAAPEVGRAYDETSHPKICLHTTEGSSLEGAERAFAAYPPHVGVDFRTGRRHQYLPLDRCSFSLKGSENDDEFVVQVEIVGFAERTPQMSADECEWLGREVIAPIAEAINCPLNPAPQGFKAPSDVTYRLAVATSPLRFPSESALRGFSGVMGHQHAPAPDTHWDPGGIDIDTILTAARGDDMPLSNDDLEAIEARVRGVLNEGTGRGQSSWAGTSAATLATSQAAINLLNSIRGAVGSLDIDEAELAVALAPLLVSQTRSLSDADLEAIATAVNDEQHRRSAE